MTELLSHPDVWKIVVGCIGVIAGAFLFLCGYIVWSVQSMRQQNVMMHKQTSDAGAKRMATITQNIHASERRLLDRILSEDRLIYHQINPLRDRVSKIEGILSNDGDDPEKEIHES